MQGPGLGGVAFGDFLECAVLEERADGTIDAARAGAELTWLGLQPIQLREHFHRYRDGVLIELEKGLGVMNQNVRIQHVGFLHEGDSPLFAHGRNP